MALFVICLLFISLQQFNSYSCDKIAEETEDQNMATKHIPRIIKNFEDFDKELKGFLHHDEDLVLIFDYDGTLAPLTLNPNATNMSPYTVATLQKFTTNPKIHLVVISGRGINDIKLKVPYKNIIFGGNHGIEIEMPDGSRSDYQLPAEVLKNYRKLVDELNEKVGKNEAIVEDKIYSLTYHYENVAEEFIEVQRLEALRIIEKYGFIAMQATLAIEAKPPVNWNKGKAALLILKKIFGDDWKNKTKVIFAGDETTDEDAMRELQGTGASTFRISKDPKSESYADYKLLSQNMTQELIRWIDSYYS